MVVMLDGVAIQAGQSVYDISSHRGNGIVESADGYGIVVKFGEKRVNYSPSGTPDRSTMRTLYHKPPLILPMTGVPSRDRLLREVMESLVEALKRKV